MRSEDDVSKLDRLNRKMERVKDSKFSIPLYIATIFVSSLWLIFMNPCLMNLLLPILAILIPYKLYKEEKLRKILVAGVVVIILLSASMTLFQLGFIYDQPVQTLRSDHLRDGTVEPLYGDSSTVFNFTVNVTEEFVQDWDPENYTIYTNLTLSTIGGITREPYEGYEMTPVKSGNSSTEYYKEVTLEERLFGHRFSIRKNVTDEVREENVTDDDGLEGPFYSWERTSVGYGPVTIERYRAFQLLVGEYIISTSVIYLIAIGVLWWKKRMDSSVEKSTEGLEEKEEELEDHCPECGSLLKGSHRCQNCGWEKEVSVGDGEEEPKDEEDMNSD